MLQLIRNLLFILLVLACFTGQQEVWAQSSGSDPAGQSTELDPNSWVPILDNAAKAVDRPGVTERELDRIVAETTKIRADATTTINQLQPRLNELSQQISELGPSPAEGEPAESEEAKAGRDSLNEQFSEIDAQVKAARLAVLRAQQIQRAVVQSRQAKFFRSIFVRSTDLISVGFWSHLTGSIAGFARSIGLLAHDQVAFFNKELTRNSLRLGISIAMLLAAIYVLLRGRRALSGLIQKEDSDQPTQIYSSRFVEFCRDGIAPTLFIAAAYQIVFFGHLLTPRLTQLMESLCLIVSLYVLSVAMLRIILLPREGRSRILMINDMPARRITRLLRIGLGLAAFFAILNALAIAVVSQLAVTVLLSCMFALTVATILLWSMLILRKDRYNTTSLTAVVQTSRMMRFLKLLVQICAIAIILAAATGYIAFSEFLAQQLIFGLVVIGTVWLILRFVQNLAAPAIERATMQVGLSAQKTDLEDGKFGQATILATGLLTLALYLAAAVLLLLPWGYRTSDFYQVVENVFFGFEVGGLRISISTVLLVISLFFVGYLVTVSLRNWLKTKLLPTTSLDVGVSNSISTVFGYIGFILAAIFAVSIAGFDLSNLAIVAGALSVGVGFGLQSIVNNFVSGLILLAERPIKAGDWIVTSGGEGTVTKISVRSTEIETFDRASVIIPNSTLITDNVTNWTHENKTGRIIIPIGVAYDSDVEKVEQLLLDCAKQHRLVLGRPAPAVYFMDFGASSLDFELRCFLADVTSSLTVKSELRFAILKAFRAENIEIPFPQRDLNLRGSAELIANTALSKS